MTGIFVPWLADAARLTGYPVVEVSGWRSRGVSGRGMSAVEAVLCHHTAGPSAGEAPSLRVVRDGRAGLSGPLSHYVLGRSGSPYVVAAGRCNHAGTSSWDGLEELNGRALGIEAEDDGDGRWTEEQRDAYPRLVAACLYYMRRGSRRCVAHREAAIPHGRKIDPAGWDMDALRGHVGWLLEDPLARIPRGGAPAPPAPASAPTARRDVGGLQRAAHVTADGIWGPVTDRALLLIRDAATGRLRDIPATQRAVGAVPDGIWGPRSRAALERAVRAVQAALGVAADGIWGPVTGAAFDAARAAR